MTRAEKVAEARRLRAEGLQWAEVAERMGVAKSTAHAYATDPDRVRDRERKMKNARPCIGGCGKLVNTDGRVTQVNERCRKCRVQWQQNDIAYRLNQGDREAGRVRWTNDEILAALRAVADEDGRLPVDVYRAEYPKRGLPSDQIAMIRFGSWTEAKLAAGLRGKSHGLGAHFAITAEECRDAVMTLAREMQDVPSAQTYEAWQRMHDGLYPSAATVRRRLGGWRSVVRLVIAELGIEAAA